MAADAKALRTLLKVKGRRREEAQGKVRERQQELAKNDARCDEASKAVASAEERKQACTDKMAETARQDAFLASDLVALRHVLDMQDDALKKARTALKYAQEERDRVAGLLAEARRELARLESVIEELEKRLEALLAEIEHQAEERQDEESEEAAVGRLLARSRAEAAHA